MTGHTLATLDLSEFTALPPETTVHLSVSVYSWRGPRDITCRAGDAPTLIREWAAKVSTVTVFWCYWIGNAQRSGVIDGHLVRDFPGDRTVALATFCARHGRFQNTPQQAVR